MADYLNGAVRDCGLCAGAGERQQMYTLGCGMGYAKMWGKCDFCEGTGLLYTETGKPVPQSVVNQIKCELIK